MDGLTPRITGQCNRLDQVRGALETARRAPCLLPYHSAPWRSSACPSSAYPIRCRNHHGLCVATLKDLLRFLKARGWEQDRQESSHRVWRHSDGRRVVIAVHESQELSRFKADPSLPRFSRTPDTPCTIITNHNCGPLQREYRFYDSTVILRAFCLSSSFI